MKYIQQRFYQCQAQFVEEPSGERLETTVYALERNNNLHDIAEFNGQWLYRFNVGEWETLDKAPCAVLEEIASHYGLLLTINKQASKQA